MTLRDDHYRAIIRHVEPEARGQRVNGIPPTGHPHLGRDGL